MKTLPDQSIDMVLADPPYGTTACKWDSVIPFEPMWTEIRRLTKPCAAVVLFGKDPFTSTLNVSNLKDFKYTLIWQKDNHDNPLMARRRFLNVTEMISVFYREQPYFEPQGVVAVGEVAKQGRGKSLSQANARAGTYVQKATGYSKNILKYKKNKRVGHPTQKPVALLEYLIKTYTKPGEVVLDFCMGSGSTGVACINTKRDFIGIEKEEKYFKIANERIDFHSVHPMDSTKGDV